MENFFLGCLLYAQCLIIVAVERVEGIDIICDNTEQSGVFSFRYFVLEGDSSRHQPDHILQFIIVVEATLVYDIASDEVLFQYAISPYSEFGSVYTLYSITDRYNHIKAIHLCFIGLILISTHMCKFCTCDIFIQFTFLENVSYMARYYSTISSE